MFRYFSYSISAFLSHKVDTLPCRGLPYLAVQQNSNFDLINMALD